MNEMIDDLSGSLDSTLFPRKQWKRCTGRSSDSFLLISAFPGNVSQWQVVVAYNNLMWNLQQRDCSGFAPDSLLIASPEHGEYKPMHCKDKKNIRNSILICDYSLCIAERTEQHRAGDRNNVNSRCHLSCPRAIMMSEWRIIALWADTLFL